MESGAVPVGRSPAQPCPGRRWGVSPRQSGLHCGRRGHAGTFRGQDRTLGRAPSPCSALGYKAQGEVGDGALEPRSLGSSQLSCQPASFFLPSMALGSRVMLLPCPLGQLWDRPAVGMRMPRARGEQDVKPRQGWVSAAAGPRCLCPGVKAPIKTPASWVGHGWGSWFTFSLLCRPWLGLDAPRPSGLS